jgi:hypothetical protein
MRSWFLAAVGALAIALAAPGLAEAAPAGGHTAIDRATAAAPSIQDVRYVTRCHRVRVWRHHHRVWVRRCHRVWVR